MFPMSCPLPDRRVSSPWMWRLACLEFGSSFLPRSQYMSRFPSRGLYAITDSDLCASPSIVCNVERAIRGGAMVIQYRDKSTDTDRRRTEGSELLEVCHANGVPLIINDDIQLAKDIGADGVHVGKDDGTLATARAALGADAIVGSVVLQRHRPGPFRPGGRRRLRRIRPIFSLFGQTERGASQFGAAANEPLHD